MRKLTEAQKSLLAEVAAGDDGCNEFYRPAIRLVEAGLLIWRTENRLELTEAGRRALESRHAD